MGTNNSKAESSEPEIRRIVLLGKTGVGKSSLANTIFKEKGLYNECGTPVSVTKECQSEIREVNGRNTQLIDTPGFFDTDTNTPEFKGKIINFLIDCAPGIHSFLLLLKIERYTDQENAVVNEIVKYFTKKALEYTTVVFTRGEELPEQMKIKDWVKGNEALEKLLGKCGERCQVFDNRRWNNTEDTEDYRNNQVQLEQLINTIDNTVKKNGGTYSNQNLKKVYDDLQKEIARIRKENPDLPKKEVEQQARGNIFTSLWKKLTVTDALKTLFGIE